MMTVEQAIKTVMLAAQQAQLTYKDHLIVQEAGKVLRDKIDEQKKKK